MSIFSVQSIARAVFLTCIPTLLLLQYYEITVLGRNEIACFGPIAEISIFKYQLEFGYYNKLKVGLVDLRGLFQP